jgi:hypothetical protein
VNVADEPRLPAVLANGVARNITSEVLHYEPDDMRGRVGSLLSHGGSELQLLGEPLPWRDQIVALRDAIIAIPELANLAFIRLGVTTSAYWNVDVVQPLDGLSRSDVTHGKHLLADYALDAHGIQVLTDSHLAKAHDLSSWNITDLGHGRHLVEAPDLAAWYRHHLPSHSAVRKAREDFGAMILTKQVIADHLAPWLGRTT